VDLGINVTNGIYKMTLKSTTVSGAAALAQKAVVVLLTKLADYMRSAEGTEFPSYTEGGTIGSVDRITGLLSIAASTAREVLQGETNLQSLSVDNISTTGTTVSFRFNVQMVDGYVSETITLE
jgi:hypothetical protein